MLKIAKNLIFISVLFILSNIIPKNNKLVLLGSGFGNKFMGNPKYLYLWMLREQKKDYRFYWITQNKKLFNSLRNKCFPVLYLYSLAGLFLVLRAKIFVVEQSSKDIVGTGFILGNFKIFNTLHGTPIKNLSIDEQVKEKNLIDLIFKYGITLERKKYTMIACAKEVSDLLKKTFSNKNIEVTGYPRDDVFFDKTLSFINYSEDLKLRRYKKVFLYAPTLRDRGGFPSPFTRKFLEDMNDYFKKKSYLLMIRTHPLAKDSIDFKGLSNLVDITYSVDDIQEALIYTDILIADYSSLIFDYALTKGSIIFYPFDYKDYLTYSRDMYFDYYKDLPGPFANNEKELLSLIKKIDKWSKEKRHLNRFKKFNERFNEYQDGKSSQRVYKLLNTLFR